MTPLNCPQDYSCTYTLVHPRVITHTTGPWWEHTAGLITALVAIIILGIVLIYTVSLLVETRQEARKLEDSRKREEIKHRQQLELEQQRTYQLDLVKGNVDLYRQMRKVS